MLFGITCLKRLQELVLKIYREWNNEGSHEVAIVPGQYSLSQEGSQNPGSERRDIL
jgi:hypothetical protein